MWDVDVTALEAALADGACVVDVREPAEHREARVADTLLIPMGQLPSRLGELDRSKPVYVLCRSGNRSGAMTQVLRAQGFDAFNVDGGILEWVRTGRPVVTG